jgi:DASH complex subunit DAD3
MELSESSTTLPSSTNEDLTPLEQDVLDEYERLAENMKKVYTLILCFYPLILTE